MAQASVKTDGVKQFIYSPMETLQGGNSRGTDLEDTNIMTQAWKSSGQKGKVAFNNPVNVKLKGENNAYVSSGLAKGKYLYGIRNTGKDPVDIMVGRPELGDTLIKQVMPDEIRQFQTETTKPTSNLRFTTDPNNTSNIKIIQGMLTNWK
jgi:hypothetical protein